MKVLSEISNFGGSEIMQVRYPKFLAELKRLISSVIISEKEFLYNPHELIGKFTREFQSLGYTKLKEEYGIQLPKSDSQMSGVFEQISFEKDKVLIEFLFDKVSSIFFDLLKFQALYSQSKAEVGIEIVACHPLYKEMSSGVSYGEQLIYDIGRLKRHFPAVPVMIILIAPDNFDLSKVYV
ncbi:MAG: BglII/BstYI family type II restriction endonuclease [Balneola sp.]